MELLFDALGIVPNLAGGETATEQRYFEVNYTFYLNLVAFGLSGFLLYVYRRGLGAPAGTVIRSVGCEPTTTGRTPRTTARPISSVRLPASGRSGRTGRLRGALTTGFGRWLVARPSLIPVHGSAGTAVAVEIRVHPPLEFRYAVAS